MANQMNYTNTIGLPDELVPIVCLPKEYENR